MPGGRNKYTGPVNYSPEEVGGILNGSFYTATNQMIPNPASSSQSSPNSGLLQEYSGPLLTNDSHKSQNNQKTNQNFLQNAFAFAAGRTQLDTNQQNLLQQQQQQQQQQRNQKRRRSLASDQQGVPFAKMMASLHRSPRENLQSSPPKSDSVSVPENNPISSQVQSIAEKVIDRLNDAEEKNILNIPLINFQVLQYKTNSNLPALLAL